MQQVRERQEAVSRMRPKGFLTDASRQELLDVIDWHVQGGMPFPRIPERLRHYRIRLGWEPDDPLLDVHVHRVVQDVLHASCLLPKALDEVRDAWRKAAAKVGTVPEFGRGAALVPRADDPDTLVPWTEPLSAMRPNYGFGYLAVGACQIVTASLSGMRASELAELTGASCLPPVDLPGGGQRFKLAGLMIKGRKFGGTAEEWVVIEQAYRAVQLAARIFAGDAITAVFGKRPVADSYSKFRTWVNGPGQRLGLAPIPDGPINGRMLRRTLALALAHRPGGLLAAKIHLKHVSVVTTEGYAHRPGGSQAAFLAEVEEAERDHHLELVAEAYRQYREGRMPAGPGARDLIAAFQHIDTALEDHEPGPPKVMDSDQRLTNLLRQQAQYLHRGATNFCWFRDPSKALCLKLAGTPSAAKPLAGMCDSTRCPQATHHPCHRPVWADNAEKTRVFLGTIPRSQKTAKDRVQADLARVQRVLNEIDAAQTAEEQ